MARSLLRRLFRFRVSTLLILMTVCAIGMGYISNKARQQQKVVELIEHLHGYCRYQHELNRTAPPGPEWLRKLLGDHYFFSVGFVGLGSTKASDETLVKLKDLKNVTHLVLCNTNITDVGMAHLRYLTNISLLTIEGTQVTDAGLMHIRDFTNLECLGICNTQVTDAVFIHLEKMSNLRQLEVFGTRITAEGIKGFSKHRPDVTIRGFSGQ